MKTGKKNILLVEDNIADAKLTALTIQENFPDVNLTVASDGIEASEYLKLVDADLSSNRPDLILLDINLPKKNGFEVLSELKASENLKRIPVIMLSSSSAEEDISRAYGLYANCYIAKPLGLNNFLQIIKSIEYFWFNVAQLP